MSHSPVAVKLAVLLAAILIFPSASHAGELRAASWPTPPAPLAPSNKDRDFNPYDEDGLVDLAVEGHLAPTVLLARHYHERDDFKQEIRWLRAAVKLGHVPSAFELSRLYFPLSGAIGREKLPIRPDIVIAACWQAIGSAGSTTVSDNSVDETDEYEAKRTEATLMAMETLLSPSEKMRATAILSTWPESLPPEGSTDNITSAKSHPIGVDEFIALLYDYLEGRLNKNSVFFSCRHGK
jgi:hypothetical protein